MRKHIITTAVLCLLTIVLVPELFGQESSVEDPKKRAQTGMAFLNVSVDARAAAMADAMTAREGASAAMFYNPASMAYMRPTFHVALGQTQWFSGIAFNVASAAFRPNGGRYGVFGLSLMSVNYGELEETIRADNAKGFIDVGTFSPSALSAGFGYARALTDRFSVGANVKYVRESLGSAVMGFSDSGGYLREDVAQSTVAVDFGTLYRTGFRSLTFAMSARNFSREITYAEESFELPLSFNVGVAMDLVDLTAVDPSTHSLVVSFSTEKPRDYAQQARFGGEYVFMNTLALRAGYAFPTDEEGINLGIGLQAGFSGAAFGFDYAYTQLGILGNVNRLSLQLGI